MTTSPESLSETTLDGTSIAGSSTAVLDESIDGSGDETLQTSSATISMASAKKGKQKAQDSKEESESSSKKHSSADNLVGKINNLVTTDLNNITEGRDFLMASKSQSLLVDVYFLTRAFVQFYISHFRSSCAPCSCTRFLAGGLYSLRTTVRLD
jgi:hypothetical protein